MPIRPTLGIMSIGHYINGARLLTPHGVGTIATMVTMGTQWLDLYRWGPCGYGVVGVYGHFSSWGSHWVMGLHSGSLYVRVNIMICGWGSILDGLVRAMYCDVSDLACAMWVTWQENMATGPYCKLGQFFSQCWHFVFCNPNYLLVSRYLGLLWWLSV